MHKKTFKTEEELKQYAEELKSKIDPHRVKISTFVYNPLLEVKILRDNEDVLRRVTTMNSGLDSDTLMRFNELFFIFKDDAEKFAQYITDLESDPRFGEGYFNLKIERLENKAEETK